MPDEPFHIFGDFWEICPGSGYYDKYISRLFPQNESENFPTDPFTSYEPGKQEINGVL